MRRLEKVNDRALKPCLEKQGFSALANVEFRDLGVMPYVEACRLQDDLRARRIKDDVPDTVLFVEHPPVFTMGKRDCEADFVTPVGELASRGFEVVKTARGGRVTYHGPGQLVCYFIFYLEGLKLGVSEFVRAVEEVCIRTLTEFGIAAVRDPEHPGIWAGRNKIAAMGMNVSHGITMHGCAVNVDCDLAAYEHIVACGLKDKGVTSMKAVLGQAPAIATIKEVVKRHILSLRGTK